MSVWIEHELEIKCSECRRALTADYDRNNETITVSPCAKCLQDENELGFKSGKEAASL